MNDDFDEPAPGALYLVPFFEAEDAEGPNSEQFTAGFRDKDGDCWGALVPLHRDLVEREVLKLMTLELSIDANGLVAVKPAERSPEFCAELVEAGALEGISIDELVFQYVDANIDEPSEGKDGVLPAFITLRERLKEALGIVEGEILRRKAPGAAPDPNRLN